MYNRCLHPLNIVSKWKLQNELEIASRNTYFADFKISTLSKGCKKKQVMHCLFFFSADL